MPEPGRIVGLLLAAGAGSRFGADKLLAALPGEGEPLAAAAARPLCAALPEVVAVVRSAAGPLPRLLREAGCALIVNPAPARGLGTSIACGVAGRPDAAGWVIALADMPWLRAATVRAVAGALSRGSPIAAPVYRGRRGHPVGFAARFAPELQALCGDVGARSLLRRHPGAVVPIAVDDPGVLCDVDTPADLGRGAPPPAAGAPG